jgi:hypothetical protein
MYSEGESLRRALPPDRDGSGPFLGRKRRRASRDDHCLRLVVGACGEIAFPGPEDQSK